MPALRRLVGVVTLTASGTGGAGLEEGFFRIDAALESRFLLLLSFGIAIFCASSSCQAKRSSSASSKLSSSRPAGNIAPSAFVSAAARGRAALALLSGLGASALRGDSFLRARAGSSPALRGPSMTMDVSVNKLMLSSLEISFLLPARVAPAAVGSRVVAVLAPRLRFVGDLKLAAGASVPANAALRFAGEARRCIVLDTRALLRGLFRGLRPGECVFEAVPKHMTTNREVQRLPLRSIAAQGNSPIFSVVFSRGE